MRPNRVKRCTYLLPIRRTPSAPEKTAEFAEYFAGLNDVGCEILVIDGSAPEVFQRNARAWAKLCDHCPVDRQWRYLNDKVNAIHTGVAIAGNEKIILADDDIRYRADDVQQVCALLDRFEVVRPQNFLAPLPWWARLEAARMLINRATLRSADYPGTCAFRRSTMLRVGHYDGDVLFDNEEIIRHFARSGASICYANDLFVQKQPPTFRKWKEQRPRQAYEDFGLRTKTTSFGLVLPLGATAAILGGPAGLAIYVIAIGTIGSLLAFGGWIRGRARDFFPWWIALYAPLWILERAISTYWAFFWFLRRGGYPFGDRLLTKGIGRDWVEGRRRAFAAGQSASKHD